MEHGIYTDKRAAVWWKFEGYLIADGLIRPKPGARRIGYDPWDQWWKRSKSEGTARLSRLVANPLFEMVEELAPEHNLLSLDYKPESQSRLSSGEHRAILAWVHANGLLGLMPHRVEFMRVAVRWQTGSQTVVNEDTGDVFHAERTTEPLHRCYVRGAFGWNRGDQRARLTEQARRTQARLLDPTRDGTLVDPGLLASTSRGGIVQIRQLHDLRNHYRLTYERIGVTFGRYFPGVEPKDRATYDYPEPLSERFWNEYAEPVGEFLAASAYLVDAVQKLTVREFKPPFEREGRAELAALAAPVHPLLLPDHEGKLSVRWSMPSLLAGLAHVTMLELMEGGGRYLGTCERCQLPFVSGDSRAKYCSKGCRQTMQKRKRRATLRSGKQNSTERS